MTPPSADQPPPPAIPTNTVPPDLLAWAKQTFDEREYRDGVREIEATGGHSLDAVIAEIEARVHGS